MKLTVNGKDLNDALTFVNRLQSTDLKLIASEDTATIFARNMYYAETSIPAKIDTYGEVILPSTINKVLPTTDNNLALISKGEKINVLGSGLDININLSSTDPDLIERQSGDGAEIYAETQGLKYIAYAAGEPNIRKDLIWFTGGKIVSGDGTRFSIYDSHSLINREVVCQAALFKFIPLETNIYLGEKSIWSVSNNKIIMMPVVEDSIVPSAIQQLSQTEVSPTSWFKIGAMDLGKLISPIVTLADRISILSLENGVAKLESSSELGSGHISTETLAHSGEFSIKLDSRKLKEALDNSVKNVKVGILEMFNVQMMSIVSQDITHLILPLR